MDAGDWVAVGAAGVSLIGALLAYVGAKRGAQSTVEAARVGNRTAHVANLISIAQQLTESDRPDLQEAGYKLLLTAAEAMESMDDAPLLIQGVTRNAELQRALEQVRTLASQTGEDPEVEYPEGGGYL